MSHEHYYLNKWSVTGQTREPRGPRVPLSESFGHVVIQTRDMHEHEYLDKWSVPAQCREPREPRVPLREPFRHVVIQTWESIIKSCMLKNENIREAGNIDFSESFALLFCEKASSR